MSAIDPQNDTDPEMDHDGAETSGNFSGGGKSEFSARNDDTGDRVAGDPVHEQESAGVTAQVVLV